MKKSKAIPLFLAVVVLLQAYQLVKLHTLQLRGSNADNTDGSKILPCYSNNDNNSGNRPILHSSPNSVRSSDRIKEAVLHKVARRNTGANQTENGEEGFSACLMIMDDNAHLIEWLAYHYMQLPLRRLIVAVDPRSETSPREILHRWDGLIDSTEWSDIDFMPPPLMDKHLTADSGSSASSITKLFRQRQEEFYTRCMARLKYEGSEWTAFIDTDEYILINSHATAPYRVPMNPTKSNPKDRLQSAMTVLQAIRIAEKENEHLALQLAQSPCVAIPRVSFGVMESQNGDIQNGVPFGFDGKDFQTLRWRYHNGRGSKKVNKISKSILDVSRVASNLFVPTEQVMVHLPSKLHCGREEHLWVLNSYSPFVIHHYAGTWEQWSHRKDTRGRRTLDKYKKLLYNKTTDDDIRPWLRGFVDYVGWWRARTLLWRVGMILNE
jgi:hypothetical protein